MRVCRNLIGTSNRPRLGAGASMSRVVVRRMVVLVTAIGPAAHRWRDGTARRSWRAGNVFRVNRRSGAPAGGQKRSCVLSNHRIGAAIL